MNQSFYYVELHDSHPDARGFRVVGPSCAGWRGIIPRSHDGMEQHTAEQLAELLNDAYRLGQLDKQREITRALGLAR